MIEKIGRNIADLQPSIRRAIVSVQRDRSRQRIRMESSPPSVLLQNRLTVVRRVKLKRVNQIAVRSGIAGIEFQRGAKRRDRFVQKPLLLVRDGEVDVRVRR